MVTHRSESTKVRMVIHGRPQHTGRNQLLMKRKKPRTTNCKWMFPKKNPSQRTFSWMDDAKENWAASRPRFGVPDEDGKIDNVFEDCEWKSKIKKYYREDRRQAKSGGKNAVAFDKVKVEMVNCHNTSILPGSASIKGLKEGNRAESSCHITMTRWELRRLYLICQSNDDPIHDPISIPSTEQLPLPPKDSAQITMIKNCDYNEKKLQGSCSLKSQGWLHANVKASHTTWTNTIQTEEAADLLVVSSTSLKGATRKAAVSETIATKKPSSTSISKSADDILTFRKELDALALKHLGPVSATAPTSTNPVNTGSNLNTGFEEVTTGNIEAISPSAWIMKTRSSS
ncbi:hypothetical protein Tco_0366323 [Tanacetum coccineum]